MSNAASAISHERLGDLFEFQNGRGFKKSEWSQQGLPIIRIQNLNDPNANFNRFKGTFSDDILVSAGDLLFSWSGTVGSSFGPHIWQGEQGVLNQHIFKVLPKKETVVRYAFYALEQITQDIEKEVSGSVGLVHITKKRLNEFTIPVPPLPEQRRIVAILDEAFEGIAAAKANAEKNLRNAREAYEGWCEETLLGISAASVVKPLGDVCHIQTGKKDVNEGNPNGRYPFFTCASEPTYSDEYSFDAEAILIAGNGNVGQAQYFTGKFEAYQRTYVLTDFRGVTGSYLFRIIDKRLNRNMLRQKLGNTMPYIKMGMLKEFPIPMPDATAQAFVSKRAESIEAEVSRLEQGFDSRLAALDELKASLLHQAFTGQL